MKCNCIDEVEKELKASIVDKVFTFTDATQRTISHVESEIEGRKRKKKTTLFHNYCPFCGVKVETSKQV